MSNTGKEKAPGVAAPGANTNTKSNARVNYMPDFQALADIIRDESERQEFIAILCSMDVSEHDPEHYMLQFEDFDDRGLDGYFLCALVNDYSYRALRLTQFVRQYPRLPKSLVEACDYYVAAALDYTGIVEQFEQYRTGEAV